MAALVWDEDTIPLCSHRHRAGAEQPKVGCVTRKSSAWLSWPCCPPAESRQRACKVSLLQSQTREGVLLVLSKGTRCFVQHQSRGTQRAMYQVWRSSVLKPPMWMFLGT